LAPTFLEIGGAKRPKVMTGRSLVPVLKSKKEGWVDKKRNWVITGRERHVAKAREGMLPYPQRALRTEEYLYIINFAPDRWPMGNPYNLTPDSTPEHRLLEHNTFITFGDLDASPTKAWLIEHRNEEKWYYDYAFGKRPREELYVLADDPDQIKNVADEKKFAATKRKLNRQLITRLKKARAPRVLGDGSTFDKPPYVVEPPNRR